MASSSRPMILIGTLQGFALWWLWHATEYQLWPTGSAILLGICLWLTLFVPALYYLSENALAGRQRWLLLAAGGLFYGAVGGYAGWMGEPLEDSQRLLRWFGGSSPGQWLGAMAIGFMAIPLVAARRQYPLLFQLAWRNALLIVSVASLTVLFWIVLYAGAALMKSLGLRFFMMLIEQPAFYFPATGIVAGAMFAQSHARAATLEVVRTFWLSLNGWLLPLLLLFGVMWVIALPFTGLESLLATRSASFFLLWFAALSINFINCAWQDGRQAAPYPRWLARLVSLAWLSLPVVVAVAGWALLLRIRQYGWTEDRVWATFVWLLATLYSLGYAVSLLPRRHSADSENPRRWMNSIGITNVLVALLSSIALACLITPVADPRRLAVNSQAERLLAGKIEAHEFDYHYLRWRTGRWGTLKLAELAALSGDETRRNIAGRAAQALVQQERYGDAPAPETDDVLRERLQVVNAAGQPADLPDSLHHFLTSPDSLHGGSRLCISPRADCLIWLKDLNGDGEPEAVLLIGQDSRQGLSGHVLTQLASGWQGVATFHSRQPREQWLQAMQADTIRLELPQWPGLRLADEHIRLYEQH